MRKKEKARADNARIHAALSVAGVAAAVAAVAAETAGKAEAGEAKMAMAMASATELLASHCVEIAQLAGADTEQVSSMVRSGVDVRTPGDLITMTAAAATGNQS